MQLPCPKLLIYRCGECALCWNLAEGLFIAPPHFFIGIKGNGLCYECAYVIIFRYKSRLSWSFERRIYYLTFQLEWIGSHIPYDKKIELRMSYKIYG